MTILTLLTSITVYKVYLRGMLQTRQICSNMGSQIVNQQNLFPMDLRYKQHLTNPNYNLKLQRQIKPSLLIQLQYAHTMYCLYLLINNTGHTSLDLIKVGMQWIKVLLITIIYLNAQNLSKDIMMETCYPIAGKV